MDLIRSSIKVLFHDFSLEAISSYLSEGYINDDSRFKEYYIELMKWREKSFTTSEVRILYDWFSDNMLHPSVDDTFWPQFTPYEKVFISLEKCGNKLLRIIGGKPKVVFENLLRWRDLTLLTGEDLIVLPTLAKHDLDCNVKCKDFCWSNVLGHDNIKINDILKKVLSDTHAHLWASADVFDINWLIAMNHPEILIHKDENGSKDFLEEGMHLAYDIVNRYSPVNKSLREWIIIAAILRMEIFRFLYDPLSPIDSIDFKTLFFSTPIDNLINEFLGFRGLIENNTITTANGLKFDYAIQKDSFHSISEKNMQSPFMVLSGERRLLYDFFYRYFGNQKDAILFAPKVYLYVLIKNKIRREIVQTNELVGFENFQSYQNLKTDFIRRLNKLYPLLGNKHKDLLLKFAFQSSILGTTNNNFESRITPNDINYVTSFDYHKSIFGTGNTIPETESSRVTLIVHFIKKPEKANEWNEGNVRNSGLRRYLKRQLEKWRYVYNEENPLPIIGFDAAGSELNASPEVFAPTFKELRNWGYSNFTFHAGEDFYDLIHGLRSVDEAIEFLDLSSGCRIGHALALGVDAKKYYESRHFSGIVPKQILLDNLIWLKYTAMEGNIKLSPQTDLLIEREFVNLTKELGYDSLGFNVSMYDYWLAMVQRDRDPLSTVIASHLKPIDTILQHYWRSKESVNIGRKTHNTVIFPQDICTEVGQIQSFLMRKVEEKGIIIESNPSSNVKIGPFSRYSDLPLFRMHPIGSSSGMRLPVTINTDDKGVFATSLENEYSLVALSLRKMKNEDGERKWNDKEIEDYLKQLAEYSNMTRFEQS